jgi:hypothetical protein
MKQDLKVLFIFFGICVVAYLIFVNLPFKEGMTTDVSGNSTSSGGLAGNAKAYGATIKSETIKLQDMLLISKYRKDYENAILNLEDLISNMMLQTVLNVNKSSPEQALTKLNNLYQSKTALNDVMAFVDKSP